MGHTSGYHFSEQRLHLFIPFIFFLFIGLLRGQENDKKDLGSWMVFAIDNKISERWSLPIVGILSYESMEDGAEFGFVRSGVTYKTGPDLKFTLGTAYVDSQPFDHDEFESLTTQFWLYEEVTHATGPYFTHRMRLENRWINKPVENIFNLRFRYRLAFEQKLSKTLFLKCTNEPFFNFDQLQIDQNRFFLGLGGKLSKDLSLEVGYFKTHVRKDNYDRIRIALHLKTTFFQKSLEDVSSK